MEKNDLEFDNLPNRLTLFRMLMIPVIVMCLYWELDAPVEIAFMENYLHVISFIIFILASITDFFDGYIARKRNIVTVFGSFLDPIADKFLVVSTIIMLMYLDRIHPLMVTLLVLREMYMTSLRLLALSEEVDVPVSSMGKWKTGTQMVAIPMLLLGIELWGIDLIMLGTALLYLSALLSLWSALQYSLSMLKKLQDKRKQKKLAKG